MDKCERCNTETQLTTVSTRDNTQQTKLCDNCISIVINNNTNFQIIPMIVCISGSMRFYQDMLDLAEKLSLENKIVLMPFVTKFPDMPNNVAQKLNSLHCHKIDLSQELYVVNKLGYIGKSTEQEINYARLKGIKIIFSVS